MPEYAIKATICEQCGETRVRYPRIALNQGGISHGTDVLCRCEREEKRLRFEKQLEKAGKNLNVE